MIIGQFRLCTSTISQLLADAKCQLMIMIINICQVSVYAEKFPGMYQWTSMNAVQSQRQHAITRQCAITRTLVCKCTPTCNYTSACHCTPPCNYTPAWKTLLVRSTLHVRHSLTSTDAGQVQSQCVRSVPGNCTLACSLSHAAYTLT